jgi:hypothetical protein
VPGRFLVVLFVVFFGNAVVPVSATEDAETVLVGAGDIAGCTNNNDEATAKLLDDIPGTVFTAGDNAYEDATAKEFAKCYEPTWGRHKTRTRPATGDHEWLTKGAAGYFKYFGAAAGPAPDGYYSYDLGAWHVVVLNSGCDVVRGGCGPTSPQMQWLRSDLASTDAECIAAVWHRHLFSSGARHYGRDPEVTAFWETLYSFGADVVLNGHSHVYERFGLQDADGRADRKGIRQFTVGTGGRFLDGFKTALPNSEFRYREDHGVLKLTLNPGSYKWQFIRAKGAKVVDSGTTGCNGESAPSPPQSVTVEPEADATVSKADPDENFGTEKLLEADTSPRIESFLRFDVAGLPGDVTRARLRLSVAEATKDAPTVYQVDPDAPRWSEGELTWNNRPDRTGTVLDDLGRISRRRYVEYDVTDVIAGKGTYSFNIVAESSDGVGFHSEEAGNAPQLVVETG